MVELNLWFVHIHMYIRVICPGAGAEMHEFRSKFPGILLGSCMCAHTRACVHKCTYTHMHGERRTALRWYASGVIYCPPF